MSFPRYEAYKDSGVEWFGEVPEHWDVKRLRFAAKVNPSKAELQGAPPDISVSFFPMEAIGTSGTPAPADEKLLSEVETGYTYFRDDDVAVAKITPRFENGKRALFKGLSNGIGFGTTELIVLRALAGQSKSDFLYWICASSPFMSPAEGSMYGTGGQKRVSEAFVEDFPMPLPPLSEQQMIAGFLQGETAKIDALIEEQRRLIELLKEKRQAVVSHAVTTGIEPEAKLRDSGLEWIGRIPSHWPVSRLSYYAAVMNGSTPSRDTAEYWDGGKIPWLASGEVNQLVISEASEFITEAGMAAASLRLLPAGTVIVGMVGQGKTRGMSAILDIPACINQNLAGITVGPAIRSGYLLYFLRCSYESLREDGRGGQQAALNCQILSSMQVPVPPLKEQDMIVEFIDSATSRFAKLGNSAEQAIALLLERRSALISAAVTGKIDVRNYCPAKEAA